MAAVSVRRIRPGSRTVRRPDNSAALKPPSGPMATAARSTSAATPRSPSGSARAASGHVARNSSSGVGRSILDHVIAVARERGYERLSLETGATGEFAAAIGLYESVGFVACEPFGDYEASDFSRYFTLSL